MKYKLRWYSAWARKIGTSNKLVTTRIQATSIVHAAEQLTSLGYEFERPYLSPIQ